jgi:hypothetical protein
VILLSAAPWAIFLPLMFASAQLVRDMVHEKQEKIKAAMMMMGVRRTHHWLAWFIRGIGSIGLSLVVSHFPHHFLYLSPTSLFAPTRSHNCRPQANVVYAWLWPLFSKDHFQERLIALVL